MTDDLNNKAATELEIGSGGVEHSKTLGDLGGTARAATPKELTIALEASQETINLLTKELAELKKEKAKSPENQDSIDKLATLLASVISKPAPVAQGPMESDNINRTKDFTQRTTVDGRSLVEAQQTLLEFRSESKHPISIAKTFQSQFGPALAISVNGVRVSIPCDGKTYYINATHWEHARERLAKVDRLVADDDPEKRIVEINA